MQKRVDMKKNQVNPADRAGGLDSRLRKLVHNPHRILGLYLRSGMKVLDIGCGPGVFTIEAARLTGPNGKVTAIDLQDGMLDVLRKKIAGTEIERNIELRKCEPDTLGVTGKYDFILAFYMVHEVPARRKLFSEMKDAMKQGGTAMIVEPRFHVSRVGFADYVSTLSGMGFKLVDMPRIFLSRSAVMTLD